MFEFYVVYIIHWFTNDTYERFASENAYYSRISDVKCWGYVENVDFITYSITEKREY